jgi:hypothetical protein
MPAQTVIKLRRGTASQWTTANPVLAAGEMGIETDTNKSKYGDGTTAWTSLAYSVASASGTTTVEWTDVLNKPSTFTPSSHTHAISDVTNLQTSLDGKQAVVAGVSSTEIGYLDGVSSAIQTQLDGKAATSHAHAISDVTSLQTSLDGKAASVHTHAISDTTGLQTALDGKAATSHTHAISDTTGLQTTLDGKLTATVSSPTSGQVISYNGSTWVNSAAPASGGMTLISDTTLSSGQSSVTLSSIPQTYKKLELEINFTGSISAPSNATMTFNGQTNSNYGWGYPVFYAGTGTSTGTQNAIFLYGYNQTAGVILPSTTSGNTYITIPGYTSTTHPKNFQFFSYLSYMSNTIHNGAGIWNHFSHSLNPITSIGFNFSAVGSAAYRIKLWGVS